MRKSQIELDPASYQKILEAERTLIDLLPEYDAAEECGVDCQKLREINRRELERIAAIKKHYMPENLLQR